MSKYFCYDNGYFHTYDSEEEACLHAQKALDDYLTDAVDEGWPDEVHTLCWGEIKQSATITEQRPVTSDDMVGSRFDEIVDIKLMPKNYKTTGGKR